MGATDGLNSTAHSEPIRMVLHTVCSHLFSCPLSSGLLQRISLLINLYATAHPGAPVFGCICFFYVTQGLRARSFHCLTRCLLSLLLNLFSPLVPSFLCPCPLIKVFYHAGCRVLLFSSANHQRVSSNSALSSHIKSNICPL